MFLLEATIKLHIEIYVMELSCNKSKAGIPQLLYAQKASIVRLLEDGVCSC